MVSGACYVAASMSMVLMNKAVLSSFHFKCENFVVFMQCLTAVVLVKVLEGMGYVKVEPFNWEVTRAASRRPGARARHVGVRRHPDAPPRPPRRRRS